MTLLTGDRDARLEQGDYVMPLAQGLFFCAVDRHSFPFRAVSVKLPPLLSFLSHALSLSHARPLFCSVAGLLIVDGRSRP